MLFSNNRTILATAFAVTLLLTGCATTPTSQTGKPATEAGQQQNVYAGSVVGKSNKAKTISISVGKGEQAQTMMVRFDDNTKGLNYAEKGEAAILVWEQRGDDKFATEIKPKLAKLPDGVTEIKVDEMYALVQQNADMTLVDARPEMRFDQGHLPGAISIPVPKLKKMGEKVLPKEKDRLLVFYCGGPT